MNKKQIVSKIILIASLLIVVIAVVFSIGDFEDIWKALCKANYLYLLVAFGLILVYSFLEPLCLHLSVRLKNKKIHFVDSMLIALSGFFFNAITPFSSGGQPFQIYAYHKSDVDAGESTAASLINFIIYQFVITLICAVSLIFYFNKIAPKVTNATILIIIGFAVNAFNFAFMLALGMFKPFQNLIVRFLSWLKKFRLFKKINVDSVKIYAHNVQEAFCDIVKKPTRLISITLIKVVAWLIFYSIPFFALQAVGAKMTFDDIFFTIAVASFTAVIVSYIPTPGGVGGAEFAFSVLFIIFVGNSKSLALSAMLLWRFITYYLPTAISFISYLIFERRVSKNENRVIH